MDRQAIDDYIARLPYVEVFTALSPELKDKVVFGASEMLRRRYPSDVITDEIIALQSVFVAEGEKEDFAKFKRQGVKQFNIEGMHFTFEFEMVSPEVKALIAQQEITPSELPPLFGRLR